MLCLQRQRIDLLPGLVLEDVPGVPSWQGALDVPQSPHPSVLHGLQKLGRPLRQTGRYALLSIKAEVCGVQPCAITWPSLKLYCPEFFRL